MRDTAHCPGTLRSNTSRAHPPESNIARENGHATISTEVRRTSIPAITATSATHATAIATSAIGITMTMAYHLDVARVPRPSPITNVNASTIGTTRVTAPIIAIGTTPDGPSAIVIRGTARATRVV